MIRTEDTNSAKAMGLPKKNISTGLDCEVISRIEALIHKKAFLKRVFTKGEVSYCLGRHDPARHFAGRFVAKEACLKALGTGLTAGIRWQDIEVINKDDGSPGLILTGRAREIMRGDGVDGGGERNIFLSLSYGGGLAVAFVAIE